MTLGLLCALAFWLVLVSYSLPLSKDASIEISAVKATEKMTTVEKLMYLNKLKNKERKKMEMSILQPF